MTQTQSSFDITQNELYQTDYWVTEALLRRLLLVGRTVWEPCAGNHHIANVLLISGQVKRVLTSDIAYYTQLHDCMWYSDFLDIYNPAYQIFKGQYDDIITNPPYGPQNRTATKFVRRALEICDGYVAMLLTIAFDSGNTRYDLFQNNERFLGKIVLTDRIKFFKHKGSKQGTTDHAWFIWGPKQYAPYSKQLMYEGMKP